MNRDRRSIPPPIYEWVQLSEGMEILLPSDVAVEAREANRQRHEAAKAQAMETYRAQQEQAAASSLLERGLAKPSVPRHKKPPAPPKAGWYRVLPRIDELAKEAAGVKAVAGHSSKEQSERLVEARKKLLQLGPDRKFAMPRDWRVALDRLVLEMPHFREPIELARGSLALAEATGKAVRIPPMLLLGPAGVGKTHFSHRLADLLGTSHGAIAFDQPSYGGQLRGTDAAWSNTQTGMLFNLIALGEHANPVILLDELDKAQSGSPRDEIDPLAQLHGALEPESARRIVDVSVQVEFDASMVTYISTANSVRRIEAPILSRFEIFSIEPPRPADCIEMVNNIAAKALQRLSLADRLTVERHAILLLAHLSPRAATRAVEKAVARAVIDGRDQVREGDVYAALRLDGGSALH